MKKFIYILLISMLFLTACSSKDTEGEITFLNLTEYEEKLSSNDKYLVVVGNKDCSACQQYKPILQEINKNKGLEIFYIQIDDSKWTDEERKKLLEVTQDKLGVDIAGTPTSFIVENGSLKEVKVGYKEYGEILDALVEHELVES